jgi:hypothetical protein
MHSTTIAILDQLEKTPWFSRIGTDVGPSAAVVTSWLEAIEYCGSFEWEAVQLEALNQYRQCLRQRSKERFQLWNDTVDEVKKITRPFVGRKIAAVVHEYNLPEIFSIQVNHDIIGLCMESEYTDVCLPGLFTSIGYWYLNGHFPCGWWGVFPQGKLVIY